MKNTLILAVAIVAISAVSCKKTRTCDCKTTSTTVTTTTTPAGSTTSNSTSSSTDVDTAEKMTKKYFKRHMGCYSRTEESTNTNSLGGGISSTNVTTDVIECTIK